MTVRQRIIVKIFFIILFLILAPLVIAYTMGYRYNFNVGRVQKTGVLVVNSIPDEAQIYLDGKTTEKETPAVVKKILPNTYRVEVIKEGYLPWSKNLEVKSAETTFAESIVLFLDQIPRAMFSRDITDTSFSPNRTQMVYVTEEASWAEIWLYSLKNQEFTLIDRRNTESFDSVEFAWSPGSNRLYVQITAPEASEQLIYQINKKAITNLNTYFDEPITDFKWSRTSDDIFYAKDKNNLSSVNLITNQKTFLLSSVQEYFVRGNNIYLATRSEGKSLIEQFDILDTAGATNTLYELPLAKYTFEDSSYPYLLLKKNDKELLLFDTSAPFQEPILQEDALGYSWHTTSQGEKKLMYYKDFEIWIFYPQSKYNELITRFSSPIIKAMWHSNGEYIFFSFSDQAKVIELDSRDFRNVFDLVTNAEIKDFIVDWTAKNMYFIGKYNEGYGLYRLPLYDK